MRTVMMFFLLFQFCSTLPTNQEDFDNVHLHLYLGNNVDNKLETEAGGGYMETEAGGRRRRRRYSKQRPQVGDKFISCRGGLSKHGAPDGTKGCIANIWPRGPWGIYGKCVKVPTRPEYSSCKLCDYGEDCRFVEGTWPHYRIKS